MVQLKMPKLFRSADDASPFGVQSLLRLSLPLLAGAGVAEWAIYRVFSRTFQSMPKTTIFEQIYHYGTQIGQIALYFAAIIAIATLVLLVVRLGNSDRHATGSVALRLAAIGLMFVLFLSLASLVVVPDPDIAFPVATALDAAILGTVIALTTAYWQRNSAILRRSLALALALTYATTLIANASLSDSALWLREFVGEGLVVVDAALFFAIYGLGLDRPRAERKGMWSVPAAITATVAAVLFTGMSIAMSNIAETAIVPILTNYSLGFTMQLPLPVYIAGLWLTVYTLAAGFFSHQQWRVAAVALTLLFAGGYQFYVSDQFMMALAGLALLALPELLQEKEQAETLPRIAGDQGAGKHSA